MSIPTKALELMLAGWQKTHTGGSKVTFWLNDEDLAYFEAATVRKGKVAGQRYQAVLVQLTDDDQPDHESVKPLAKAPKITIRQLGGQEDFRPSFPGAYCGLAVRWCKDEHFRAWLFDTYPACLTPAETPPVSAGDEAVARAILLKFCGVSSRKELDTDDAAKALFQKDILEPYSARRREDGVDE